jgi:uncharacterized protein YecT (DUF1311 family)
MSRFIWGFLLTFSLVVGSPVARAFDCAKAYLPVDFVICSDPAVFKANEAHEKAWYETRARLNDPEKQELLGDQRRWLKEYPPHCGVPAKGKPLPTISKDAQLCVAKALEERRAFLEQYPNHAAEPQPATQTAAAGREQPCFAYDPIEFGENGKIRTSTPARACIGADGKIHPATQPSAGPAENQATTSSATPAAKVPAPPSQSPAGVDCAKVTSLANNRLKSIFGPNYSGSWVPAIINLVKGAGGVGNVFQNLLRENPGASNSIGQLMAAFLASPDGGYTGLLGMGGTTLNALLLGLALEQPQSGIDANMVRAVYRHYGFDAGNNALRNLQQAVIDALSDAAGQQSQQVRVMLQANLGASGKICTN